MWFRVCFGWDAHTDIAENCWITKDGLWIAKNNQITAFMVRNHRRPSKHNPDE